MEEAMWLYFSVLAVLIAFGVIGTLFAKNSESSRFTNFERSLESLKAQCDYICATGVGTELPVDVTLPAGLVLYTNGDKICGTLEDLNRCQLCDCRLVNYSLDLNTSFARKALKTHKYACSFKRLQNDVSITCQG